MPPWRPAAPRADDVQPGGGAIGVHPRCTALHPAQAGPRHGLTPEASDDRIDALAILAQTLVTGDKALLTLRARYTIRTPAEFWAEHGGL
jgi:hypothetical protein